MSKTLKKLTKIGFLIFGISFLFLTSCEKEDTFIENISTLQKSNIIVKRVTIKEIQKNETLKLSLDKIEKQFDYSKKSNEFSKIKSTDNSFSILTNEILKVNTDSTEAYTFRIETPTHSDSSFENFVIEKRNDNNYQFYIYRYKRIELEKNIKVTHSVSKELVNTNQINLFDFKDLISNKMVYNEDNGCLLNVTYNEDCSCQYAEVIWCPDSGSGGGGGGSSSGEEGSSSGEDGSSSGGSSTGSGSTNGTGGSEGNENNGHEHGGSGSSSNSNTGTNNGGGSTIGILPNPIDIAIDSFFENLTDEQKDCLNTKFSLRKQIRIFLENNMELVLEANGNANAQDFAIQAIEAVCEDGEVDFENKVILDSNFKNSITKCIHDKMKSNTNNIYSKMLNHFNSSTQKNIIFSINNSIGSDWGITNGNPQVLNDYNVIINQNIIETNGSNLMRYVTLSHELIHAFMFDALEDVGVITFDSTGSPILNVNCPTNNINLNNQNIKDRFVSLICAMNSAGTLTQDWTHDLFNSNVFNIQDYRQQLENLILNDYDWNSENSAFTSNANTTFGSNWKQEVSQAISWIGLENTNEYSTYINNYSTQPLKFLFISDIRNKISNTNNNCP